MRLVDAQFGECQALVVDRDLLFEPIEESPLFGIGGSEALDI